MLLATYGTFRKGEALAPYLEGLRRAGTCETVELTGIKIFVLGMAPGAKITGNPEDKAVVELIDVDLTGKESESLLYQLDRIEGVDQGMYRRDHIDTPKGRALIYTKIGNCSRCVVITDWKKWQRNTYREKYAAMEQLGKDAICIT